MIKQEVMTSELSIQLNEVYGSLAEIMHEIQDYLDYPICFKDECDIVALLKHMEVKFIGVEGDLVERLIDYSKILNQLLRQDIMVLVNIQSYLREEEIQTLLKHANYEKLHFLFIENVDRGLVRERIRKIIIDKDRCEIY